MKNHFFAAYKFDMNIAVFKTVEERDSWLKGKDIVPAGDPVLAEEREALTLDDVRTSFYPRTDAEIMSKSHDDYAKVYYTAQMYSWTPPTKYGKDGSGHDNGSAFWEKQVGKV